MTDVIPMLLAARYRVHTFVSLVVLTMPLAGVRAQETQPDAPGPAESTPDLAALRPLFTRLTEAKSTRASVQLSADTIIDGAVINTQTSVYQIASQAPDQFTIYLKDQNQRVRIFSDGQTTTVALSEQAFTVLDKPLAMQQAVFDLPLPMGPYPEPNTVRHSACSAP